MRPAKRPVIEIKPWGNVFGGMQKQIIGTGNKVLVILQNGVPIGGVKYRTPSSRTILINYI